MQNNNTNISSETPEPRYAGFGIRLGAYIIDNLILGIGLLVVKFIIFIMTNIVGINFFSNQILFQYTLSDIILYICRALYFVLLTYFTSATIGKHILKLKVISTNNNGQYTFIDILYRETIGRFLSNLIIHAGYILIFINKDKSSLHDMLADTRVIYKNNEPKAELHTEENVSENPENIIYDYIPISETFNKSDKIDENDCKQTDIDL